MTDTPKTPEKVFWQDLPEEDQHETIQALQKHFAQPKRVHVICHANPDGDAIGAMLGLYHALNQMGHDARPVCKDACPDILKFLPGSEDIDPSPRIEKEDTIVLVDCGDKHLTRLHDEYPEILEGTEFLRINIDHHPSNELWANYNIVQTNAASTTQILLDMLKAMNVRITPDIATCLLTGIYTDTGGFMHQNSNPAAFRASSELVRLGADLGSISQNIFQNYELKTLKLWGEVLSDLHVTPDGAAIVGVNEAEYSSIGCTRQDLGGVVDYINSLEEADYSVLLTEDGKGNVKASLRTRKEHVNVQELASLYGGGGHVKASGFTIPKGKLQKEVRWKIVTEE